MLYFLNVVIVIVVIVVVVVPAFALHLDSARASARKGCCCYRCCPNLKL